MRSYLLLIFLSPLMLFSYMGAAGQLSADEDHTFDKTNLKGFDVIIREKESSEPDIREAIELLDGFLEEINNLIRPEFLDIMQSRPVWLKLNLLPGSAAWYHPNSGWLSANGHNPDKALSVEIANASNFIAWTELNQPYMVLHEMAHLIHHQYFGHDYHAISNAFIEAKASGKYESVPYFGGENTYERTAYAMENDKEYFAELSEAYFGRNDYYPFDYNELKEFDTLGFHLMESAWGTPPGKEHSRGITSPFEELGLDGFYKKYLNASGLPVISSWIVYDEALLLTRDIVNHMVSGIPPEALDRMIEDGLRVGVIGRNQITSDMPEYSDLNEAFPGSPWDNYRGLGPTFARPLASSGEENLLQLPGDIYTGENILIHEFAHAIDLMGLRPTVEGFEDELLKAYDKAMEEGLWHNTYAAVNSGEYFAEGVQSWYNANRFADPPDGVHNHVNTRDKLKEYDRRLYDLLAKYFPDDDPDFFNSKE